MKSKKLKDLTKKNQLKFAVLDAETAKKVLKISKLTHENPTALISASIQLLEKCMGREVVIHKPESEWNLKISQFLNYPQITKFEPDGSEVE